jgi:uncharacterized protein YndB with AHSA1/START domain
MKNERNSATAAQTKPIIIKRSFKLPLDVMWKAWSDPSVFKKWWGPEGYTCPDCTIDFRTGGKYLASMQDKEGRKIWSTGTIREIDPLKKIVYTDNFSDERGNIISPAEAGMPGEWNSEMLVTVEMRETNGNTEIALTHTGIPGEMYDECVRGWQSSFDKLEKIGN